MAFSGNPQILRVPLLIDCGEPEVYILEDLLHDVRAIEAKAKDVNNFFASDQDLLVWALGILCESPLMRSIAFDARFEDWGIEFDECDHNIHIVDPQLRILIMPRLSPNAATLGRSPHLCAQFLIELASGLRAIWHHNVGVRHGYDLGIRQQIFWNRLCQADHDLTILVMAWELREAGLPELWRVLISSELGNLAVAQTTAFENGIRNLPATLFLAWMEDDTLLNATDHRTLEKLDAALGRTSNVHPYGGASVSESDLLRLSSIPGNSPYLLGIAPHILQEIRYIRMPDLVNETHLLHLLQDLTALQSMENGFRDRSLAIKFFPGLTTGLTVDA